MKKFFKYFLVITSVCYLNFGYAAGYLEVTNHVPDLEVYLKPDLICGLDIYGIRDTSPLKENPILDTQGEVEVWWQNCRIVPEEAFKLKKLSDHSKIHIKLVDKKTGDTFTTIMQTYGGQTKKVNFSDNYYQIDMELYLYQFFQSRVILNITKVKK